MNLIKRFQLAGDTARRLQPDVERARLREYENALAVMREVMPKLRAQHWDEVQSRRAILTAEQNEVRAGIKATRERLAECERELTSARAAGDIEAAAAAAAEMESLDIRLRLLKDRKAGLGSKLGEIVEVTTFAGTLEEFREALLRPDFFVDRTWSETLNEGLWRWSLPDQRIFVKFRVDNGDVLEYGPKKPDRLPWRAFP